MELMGLFVLILVSAAVCKVLFDKRCPKCRMAIPRSARICPHCKEDLAADNGGTLLAVLVIGAGVVAIFVWTALRGHE